jgi:hypothetical protein
MLDLPAKHTALLTKKQREARLHVLPMGQLQPDNLEQRRVAGGYSTVVAIRPTGESSTS